MSKLPISPRDIHYSRGGTKDASDATIQWLQDAPAASADALQALGHGTNGGGGGGGGNSPFEWPANGVQLRDCLQTAADESRVAMLDPRTHIEISETIKIQQRANYGCTWGVNGNHARLQWRGPGGHDVLVYQGFNGVSNRGLFIEKLNIDGNGYAGAAARFGMCIYAPEGDPGVRGSL
jgi:hypothetical protein